MIGSLPRRTANERSGSQGSEWCVPCEGGGEKGLGLIGSVISVGLPDGIKHPEVIPWTCRVSN